jgi:hypothetical protein
VNPKKENAIIKYIDFAYGDRETFESEKSIGVNGVCIYHKNIKKVGFVGEIHKNLSRYFGEGRYYPQLHKWFSNKFNVEVI